jgi:hypothetical protein
MENQEEYILIWEAPKVVPPEFRLYYDDTGKVLCYTCEKLEGNYIVVDSHTYAEARPDIRVIDGKISTVSPHLVVSKLVIDNEGQACAYDNISIVVDSSEVETKKWKLKTYELIQHN